MDATRGRRKLERQRCTYNVNWSYFNRGSYLNGHLLNVSQGGSYLETTQPIAPGKTVLIRVLQCTDGWCEHPENLRLNAIAEVKWCRELSNNEKIRYGIGVRYHFPS